MTEMITRRHLLGLAGASAAGAMAACVCSRPAQAATHHIWPVVPEVDRQHFVTQPQMQPPKIAVTQYGPISPSNCIFLDTPASGPGVGGAVVIDSKGELVWFGPDTRSERKLDVNVQKLDGEPVLTWFQGGIVHGHGEGVAVIADNTYTVKQTIEAFNSVKVDLHEFYITPHNHAIVSAYRTYTGVDLTGVGGPASGVIYSGVFQVIGLVGAEAGKLLFEWDSYNYVPVTESHRPVTGEGTAANPYDYFHINSICTDADGNYIVSGRHTWTIYKIDRTDGSIMWRMNGKKSDFKMGKGAPFHWQHHVRTHPSGDLTVFDNGAAAPTLKNARRSRAMILSLDETTMQANLVRAFTYGDVLAQAMGSVQMLPDGDVFVNWGSSARFSQFTADGKLVMDGRMNSHAPSYRGFSMPWTGHPTTQPTVVATRSASGATVYASWNGATEVASWVIWAGKTSYSLARVGEAPRTGFETAINVKNAGPYFMAIARDANEKILRRSEVVKIS